MASCQRLCSNARRVLGLGCIRASGSLIGMSTQLNLFAQRARPTVLQRYRREKLKWEVAKLSVLRTLTTLVDTLQACGDANARGGSRNWDRYDDYMTIQSRKRGSEELEDGDCSSLSECSSRSSSSSFSSRPSLAALAFAFLRAFFLRRRSRSCCLALSISCFESPGLCIWSNCMYH